MEHQLTQFNVDHVRLEADVDVPPESVGVHSPRNQHVARVPVTNAYGEPLID